MALLGGATLATSAGGCGGSGDGATAIEDDGGSNDGATGDDGTTTGDDGGGGSDGGGDDSSTRDTVPPAKITLSATAHGLTSIQLDWIAVGDDGNTGTASGYDVRISSTPITTIADFNASTVVTGAPNPATNGIGQSMIAGNLTQGTAYYFAIRARDDANNWSDLSNSPTATTLVRATLQISEVAPANAGGAEGRDFVELVALTTGRVDGLELREASGSLYTFGNLQVTAGDRLVVHADGLPCAAGCASEDTTTNMTSSTEPFATATAWDVYSSSTGISAADNVLTLLDGATVVDAVAISNRDGDASASNMTAFATAKSNGSWAFAATPVDAANDCATQKDAVSIATTATTCGGQPAIGPGLSVQRVGTTDTGTRADFYAAAETRGVANGANPGPTVVSATATASDTVHVVFSEDIKGASVTSGAFTGTAGLTISAATLSDVNEVTLTTSAQTPGQGYSVDVASSIQDLQGTALGAPTSAGLCGFSASPVAMIVNEVAPDIAWANPNAPPATIPADLVELRVTSGGAIGGITLRANPTAGATGGTLLATMPSICAATGDLVVVHLHPANAPGAAPATETLAKNEFPNATYSANYDGAWDVKSSNSNDISGTTQLVLMVLGAPPGGSASPVMLDAVAFTKGSGTTGTTFKSSLDYILSQSQWTPACGASPCDDTTSLTAVEVSASYNGVGSTPTDSTVRRDSSGTDTNGKSDWSVGASTLGAAN